MILHHHPLPTRGSLQIERRQLQVVRHDGGQARAAAVKIRIGEDQLVGHHVRLENLLAGIDIAQETIPRPDALDQAGLEPGPFFALQDEGHQVGAILLPVASQQTVAGAQVGAVFFTKLLRQRKNAGELVGWKILQTVLQAPDQRIGLGLRR